MSVRLRTYEACTSKHACAVTTLASILVLKCAASQASGHSMEQATACALEAVSFDRADLDLWS